MFDWLAYRLSPRRQIARHIADDLQSRGFPRPTPSLPGIRTDDPCAYLMRVKSDARVPQMAREHAAAELGRINASRRLYRHYDDAIESLAPGPHWLPVLEPARV